MTPNQRHEGLDVEILAKRQVLYRQKRNEHPERWSGCERNWEPRGTMKSNPNAFKLTYNPQEYQYQMMLLVWLNL